MTYCFKTMWKMNHKTLLLLHNPILWRKLYFAVLGMHHLHSYLILQLLFTEIMTQPTDAKTKLVEMMASTRTTWVILREQKYMECRATAPKKKKHFNTKHWTIPWQITHGAVPPFAKHSIKPQHLLVKTHYQHFSYLHCTPEAIPENYRITDQSQNYGGS